MKKWIKMFLYTVGWICTIFGILGSGPSAATLAIGGISVLCAAFYIK